MKHVLKFAFATMALVAIGCGGSGNGAAPTIAVPSTKPRVEAIVRILATNLLNPTEFTATQLLNPQTPNLQSDLVNQTLFGVEDPNNIQANEQVVFQLVNYTTDGSGNLIRNILPATAFITSDTAGTYGSLSSASGVYVAGPSKSNGTLYCTAIYNGVNYTTPYAVQVDQVRLLGTVLAEGTNAAQLAGAKLHFYDGTGSLVGTVTVQYDGSFRASVPTTASTFTIIADTVPTTFYASYNYLSLQYDAGVSGCYAPLPTGLAIGTSSLAGTIYVTPRITGQDAPPSTGCTELGTTVHAKKSI